MKIIDYREMKEKQKQTNKQRQKRTRGIEAIVKGWRLNDFVVQRFSPITMQSFFNF